MQLQNDRWRYGNGIVLLVNKRQHISVSSDFFLCAGAWLGGIRHDRFESFLGGNNSFKSVGGLGALDLSFLHKGR